MCIYIFLFVAFSANKQKIEKKKRFAPQNSPRKSKRKPVGPGYVFAFIHQNIWKTLTIYVVAG